MVELKCEKCGTITTALNARQVIYHASCPKRPRRADGNIPRYVPVDRAK